jgi:hypothetical protein
MNGAQVRSGRVLHVESIVATGTPRKLQLPEGPMLCTRFGLSDSDSNNCTHELLLWTSTSARELH